MALLTLTDANFLLLDELTNNLTHRIHRGVGRRADGFRGAPSSSSPTTATSWTGSWTALWNWITGH
ncbi:MAG: hypothetical protein R3A10_21555 [Caldilineaceae bacterium]